MAFNTSIPLQVRTPDVSGTQGKIKAIQVQEMLDNKRLRDLQTGELERKITQDKTLREGLTNAVNPTTGQVDVNAVQSAYTQSGQPLEGMNWVAGYRKAQREGKVAEIEYMDKSLQLQAKLLASSKDPVSYQANYNRAVEFFGKEMMEGVPAQYPGQKAVQQMLYETLDAKDRLTQQRDDEKFSETKRHNKETEKTARMKAGKETTNKTGDANFFRKMGAEYYGGFVNPDTGAIQGLNTEEARQVTSIAARANQIFQSSDVDQNTAFQMAADEMSAAAKKNVVDEEDEGEKQTAKSWLESLFGE